MLNVLTEREVEASVSKPVASETEFKRMRAWLDERIAKGKKEPHAEVVALTPCLASLLLERNPINRPIGRLNSDMLRADVANGRFSFNGESIVVSNTGVLLDGQHRCSVVIETKVPITTVVVFGPKEDARYTIDIGRPKSASHFLHMKGYADTNNLAATLALLILYGKTGNVSHGTARPTKTEITAGVGAYRALENSLAIVHNATKKRLGPRSALAFCHYVFKRKGGADAADEFMSLLIDGDGLRKGSPIYYCRERLLTLDRGTRAEARCELVFKAWNAWRRGEKVTSFKLTGSLPKVER